MTAITLHLLAPSSLNGDRRDARKRLTTPSPYHTRDDVENERPTPIMAAFEVLPEQTREILLRKVALEETFEEIGQSLGISPQKVGTIARAAIKQLRQLKLSDQELC